ncbi:hypothetical protein K7432_002212 [Basidiobolus ranarum]|uniref:Transmembrane protein n=1 Tax=Basidiobolus ranarum TaxID=34480 RepID=A0ABR2X1Y2_9FUNG
MTEDSKGRSESPDKDPNVQTQSKSTDQEKEEEYLELVREAQQANHVFKLALHILPTILLIVYFWTTFASIQEYIQTTNASSAISVSMVMCLISLCFSIYVLHLASPSRFFMRTFLFFSILPLLLMGPSSLDGMLVWGMPVIVHLIQSFALKLMQDDIRKLELQGAKLKKA